MKIRKGFVSNSSSSSFVCEKCGESYEGWDGNFGDIENYTCLNGHDFCSDCISLPDEERKYSGEFSKELCPICQLKMITDHDALRYLMWDDFLNKEQILQLLKNTFSTYENFQKAMKEADI